MVYLSNFVKLNFCANMKYFIGLSLLLLSNFTNGQKIYQTYDKVVVDEEFTTNINEWPINNSSSEIFHILDQAYDMKRVSLDYFSIVFAKGHREYSNFQITAKVKIKKNKANRDASGGVVFRAQKSGEDALILEINNKNEYRLQLIRQGSLIPFFKNDSDGWIETDDLNPNKYNSILIKAEEGIIDLYLNEAFQRSFVQQDFKPGAVGLYLDANSHMIVDRLTIAVGSQISVVEETEEAAVESEAVDDDGFQEILLVFRKKIGTQQARIEDLEGELARCKSNFNADTTLRGNLLELKTKNKELNKQVNKLEESMLEAQNRLEYLESMKSDIESDPNGDIILKLTELLSTEKKKNKELKKEIEELKKQF
jgi:hypothetical protein